MSEILERYTFTAMGEHTEATTVLSFRVPTEHAQWVRDKAATAGMKPNKALRLWLAATISKEEEE